MNFKYVFCELRKYNDECISSNDLNYLNINNYWWTIVLYL